MKGLSICIVLLTGSVAFGQDTLPDFGPVGPGNGIPNGIGFIPEHIPTKRMVPYEAVREADIIWSKRVWRTLDMRERMNHPMYYPNDEVTSHDWQRHSDRWSLWTIIRKHVMNGDLTIFSPYNPLSYGLSAWDGDQLKYPITPIPGKDFYSDANVRDEMLYYLGRLGPHNDVKVVDEYGEPVIDTLSDGTTSFRYHPRDTIWYNSADIIEYRIKEDWFFDKERSSMDVRIIAIAPVVYDISLDNEGNKQINGKKELFWLYFPHCRYVLNNYVVYNDRNDSRWMSYDDLFRKRRFSSYIYKESNSYDRRIEDYMNGIDALRESVRITNDIRNFEHDMWSY